MEAGISSLKYGSSSLLRESFLIVWTQFYAQESVSGSIEAVFCTGKCCWKYGSSVLHKEVLLAVCICRSSVLHREAMLVV